MLEAVQKALLFQLEGSHAAVTYVTEGRVKEGNLGRGQAHRTLTPFPSLGCISTEEDRAEN